LRELKVDSKESALDALQRIKMLLRSEYISRGTQYYMLAVLEYLLKQIEPKEKGRGCRNCPPSATGCGKCPH
jgi:hypothetical protein